MQRRLLILLAAVVALAPEAAPQIPQTARDSARLAVDRLGYGPSPGLVDSVARAGVMIWVDQQITGAGINGDGLTAEARAGVLSVPTEAMVRLHVDRVRQLAPSAPDSGRRVPPASSDASRARGTLRRHNMDLAALTLVRAIEGHDQLGEVLADFWLNHFNVFINKGLDRAYFRDHLEVTIRPNVRGSFGALLAATASSPAMLVYLDNVQSVADATGRNGPSIVQRRGTAGSMSGRAAAMPTPTAQRAPRGINENYARELLELHTVGVDGGFSQSDVADVARIFTGWTIGRAGGGTGFQFNMRVHDRAPKVVLGTRFPAGGDMREGQRLLALLAMHPATMRHLSTKLCIRFVADNPPQTCVDAATRAWASSNGSIASVVRAIVHTDAFWASGRSPVKVKSPLEFMVSAVRVTSGIPDMSPRLSQQLERLGQPLFQHVAPTGYPETQEDWVNSGALLARMNFGIALAANQVPGVVVNLDPIVALTTDHAQLVTRIDREILGGRMTSRTHAAILDAIAGIADPREARARAVGMALGGPEFQQQ